MKILIFGAAGMIGHRIWLEGQNIKGAEVFGVIRKPRSHYEKFKVFNKNIIDEIDVSHWEKVEELLNKVKPDIIINAIGITIRKPEMNDYSYGVEINSFFPRRLLKWVQANATRVIHLSTDCVFDGSSGKYTETSQPTAKDNYGKTKFLGEIDGEKALTLRFSCIGRELDSHTELLEWFLAQDGKEIKGFGKVIYSGVTTHIVAREVMRVMSDFPALCGIFQLSSTPISKYDLLCLIQKIYGTHVRIERSDDYIADKSLVCDKYVEATRYKPQEWIDMIKELHADTRVNYKA